MATEKQFIDMDKRLHRITSQDKSVLDYDEVKKSIELIQGMALPNLEEVTSRAINPKNIVKIARKDLLQLFPNLNREILFIDIETIKSIARQSTKKNYSYYETLLQLNAATKTIDIFSLPLHYTLSKERYGSLEFPRVLEDDDEYLSKIPLTFSHIELMGPSDYLTALGYQHELIHGLTERFRGIFEDFYHEEVLPIFIETILGLEIDSTETLLQKLNTYRLISNQNEIAIIATNEDTLDEEAHKHLISTLISNCMFNRYYNETPTGRKYILSEIQKILNGEKTLGQFLQEQAIALNTNEVVTATEHIMKRILTKKV